MTLKGEVFETATRPPRRYSGRSVRINLANVHARAVKPLTKNKL